MSDSNSLLRDKAIDKPSLEMLQRVLTVAELVTKSRQPSDETAKNVRNTDQKTQKQ